MKKLKLEKLLVGSLTAAQQKNVLGGVYDGSANSDFKVNTMCVTPPPAITSIDTPCSGGCPSPPPQKTTNTTPCA